MVGLLIRDCFRASSVWGVRQTVSPAQTEKEMKPKIKGIWIVEGFYRFESRTCSWEYECGYGPGEVIWELDGYTITCRIDGSLDHIIPYRIVRRRTLVMDFSILYPSPDGPGRGSGLIESCRIEMQGGHLWLLDRKIPIPGVGSYALKLTRPPK